MKEQAMESEHTAERLYVGLPDHEDCIEIRSHDDRGEKLLASVGGDTDDHEAELAFAERLVSRYNALSGISYPVDAMAKVREALEAVIAESVSSRGSPEDRKRMYELCGIALAAIGGGK